MRCCLLLALLATQPAFSAVVYVDADLSTGADDGSSWANAFRGTLARKNALASVPPGASAGLWIANGTYKPGAAGAPITSTFAVPSGVALYGGFAGGERSLKQRDPAVNLSILSGDILGNDVPHPSAPGFWNNAGDNVQHVVSMSNVDATALLDGLVIRRGSADGSLIADRRGANVIIEGGSPTIVNCTIADGYASTFGAGIAALGGAPNIAHCTFKKNRCDFNGGGFNAQANCSATITDCLFIDNIGGLGCGIGTGTLGFGGQNSAPSNLTIKDTRFESNDGIVSAASGVGMLIEKGASTVERCSFVGNTTQAGGGGAYLIETDTTFTSCDFVANSAPGDGGGAFYSDGGSLDGPPSEHQPTFINCRFNGNNGVGVCVFNGSATLINCTLAHSSQIQHPGWPTLFIAGSGTCTLRNCVVAANAPMGAPGFEGIMFSAQGGTYDVAYCSVQSWDGSLGGVGNDAADPVFVDTDGADNLIGTEDDDLRLSAGSPCIDAGNVGALPKVIDVDLDGAPRRVDDPATRDAGAGRAPVVDRGCYEFQPPNLADLNDDGVVDAADLAILLGAWGTSGPGDLDGDGVVNGADLALLLGAWSA